MSAAVDTLRTLADDGGRARLPDATGVAVAEDGVRLAYDVYGSGDPTIVLLPSAPIVHARQWKAQIPYLSRHYRVIAFDGRGNGRSDRPTDPAAYHDDRMTDDIAAVMDATDTPRALLVGLCFDGVWRAVRLAAEAPERVAGHRRLRDRRATPHAATSVVGRRPLARRSCRPTRAGPRSTGTPGGSTTPTPRSSSSRRSTPSRTRPS